MIAVLTLVLVLSVSMLIIRVGAVALTLTGVSEHLARFQARSAFFGVGFTTRESEDVVNHPVRRHIISLLIIAGQVGVMTTLASLIGSFVSGGDSGSWLDSRLGRVTLLASAFGVLLGLSYSPFFSRLLSATITWTLRRWTRIEVQDYALLLRMSRDYAVSEMLVEPEDWLTGRSLKLLELGQEGVLVLGIERASGKYIGAPRGSSVLEAGDTVILYGRQDRLEELDERKADFDGQFRHVMAVTQALDVQKEEAG